MVLAHKGHVMDSFFFFGVGGVSEKAYPYHLHKQEESHISPLIPNDKIHHCVLACTGSLTGVEITTWVHITEG